MTSPVTQQKPTVLRALSIHQPWADLIAMGHKNIETRCWETPYRGPLLICASLKYDKLCKLITKQYQDQTNPQRYCKSPLLPEDYEPRLGQALVLCTLADCRPMEESDRQAAGFFKKWSVEDKYSWLLTDIRPIVPIPIKGYQRLFYPDKQGITLDSMEFIQMELFDSNSAQEAA